MSQNPASPTSPPIRGTTSPAGRDATEPSDQDHRASSDEPSEHDEHDEVEARDDDEADASFGGEGEALGELLAGVDPDALKVVRRLLTAGHEAYLVGGCVRDLYLGRQPKDFDIATSATPEAIRKLFRNSRIIGRRFKLAHVFFGPKIIETSTFRTAPPKSDDDPLITHDNEWGSVEDDARRRDFTINGLFFDVESEKVVDFVDGMADLDAKTIRTIGDPILRFREDPVRMIRAVKFAARLDFHFDPTTWEALLEVVPDIVKCSKARVLEEIYKLLRGGASRRSFELLLETGMMQHLMPVYLALFGKGDPERGARALADAVGAPALAHGDFDEDGEALFRPAQLFWRYLAALDDYVVETGHNPTNGVLQAVLFAPVIADELQAGSRQSLDRRIDGVMTPVGAAMGIARRDRELSRQILMAHRRMVEPTRKRRRASMAQRQYFHDALVFLGMAVKAAGGPGTELQHWRALMAMPEALPREPKESGGRKKRRRRRPSRNKGGSEASVVDEG